MKIQSPFFQFSSSSIDESYNHAFKEKELDRLFNSRIFPKIKAKPISLEKIRKLNNEIHEIEKKIDESPEKIDFLQGGKAAKLTFIGFFIKLLFQWINGALISQENKKLLSLKKRKAECEQIIFFLKESLPVDEEDNPAAIFEFDYQIRKILELNLPNHKKYLMLYNKQILPVINQIKSSITEERRHFNAFATAKKGKAVQAGLKALKNLTLKNPIIRQDKAPTQHVYLLPENGVVFKDSKPRQKEEEAIANALFALMSKDGTVGAFNISKTSAKSFGIEIPSDELARCLSLENVSQNLFIAIKKRLAKDAILILDRYAKQFLKENPNFEDYQEITSQEWCFQNPEEPNQNGWERKPFKELFRLHLTGELSPEIRIGISPETAISLREHIFYNQGQGTLLARALAYLPTLKDSPKKILLAPDLSNAEVREAYELCERFKWIYIEGKNPPREVDFKTLHCLFLEKELMQQEFIIQLPSLLFSNEIVKKAFSVEWKIIYDELIKDTSKSTSALSNIVVKPFINEMILMSEIDQEMREIILNRLTPDGEFNAILTGEIQFLDMHPKNLGLMPESNQYYEYFKNILFTLASGSHDFKKLMLLYLKGKISSATFIQFEDHGVFIQKPLAELPLLEKALNTPWQLLIFDTDLSLTEDNRLQFEVYRGVPQHLIPLRSVLLETTWKDKPLCKKTVQRLLESEERDFHVMQWAQRLDAPIYKQLSPLAIKDIENYIAPYIQKYSLSIQRKEEKDIFGHSLKNNEAITINGLRDQFTQEICDPNVHHSLWKMIEEDLSYVTVRSCDTWESLAGRHKQNIEALKKMNQNILISEKRLKIQYDLTSSSSVTIERRKRIARQLFPRITYRQLKALKERFNSRKEYLRGYYALSSNFLNDKELISNLKKFIVKPSTPLSNTRKKEYLLELNQRNSLTNTSEELLLIKESLCKECEPTYFNLMKAMYPLLSDAYALNLLVYQNSRKAGHSIGLYNESLEFTICVAEKQLNFNRSSLKFLVAQYLTKKIKSIKDPAFFGYWS